MTDDVLASKKGALGLLILNRPQALNALTLDMVSEMARSLTAFEADSDVKTIAIASQSDKAFCAGGDVRASVASRTAIHAKRGCDRSSDERMVAIFHLTWTNLPATVPDREDRGRSSAAPLAPAVAGFPWSFSPFSDPAGARAVGPRAAGARGLVRRRQRRCPGRWRGDGAWRELARTAHPRGRRVPVAPARARIRGRHIDRQRERRLRILSRRGALPGSPPPARIRPPAGVIVDG